MISYDFMFQGICRKIPRISLFVIILSSKIEPFMGTCFFETHSEVAPGAPAIGSQCHPTVEISTMLHEWPCQRTCLSSMNWPDRRPVQRQRFSWWSVWWQKNSCDMPCLCKRRAKPMLCGGKLSKNFVVSRITRWSPLDSKLDASSYIYIYIYNYDWLGFMVVL